jgi:hypothetical protein
MGALVVDVAAVTTTALVVALLPGVAWEQVTDRAPGWVDVIAGVVAGLVPWAYFTICWWLTGQTAGDLLFGVVLTTADGERVGMVRAALRAAVGLVLAPLWLVGLLAVLWDRRRRSWLDRVFGTAMRYNGQSSGGTTVAGNR